MRWNLLYGLELYSYTLDVFLSANAKSSLNAAEQTVPQYSEQMINMHKWNQIDMAALLNADLVPGRGKGIEWTFLQTLHSEAAMI